MPNKKVKVVACKQDFRPCNCGGAIYGLGFVGALIYYLSTATSFWAGIVGILKAIVWPTILVYGSLKALGL
ncbi:MAG: hypothetical protein V1678_05175 [Candidatus Aenigmatarchaeota archaeon]